jgi:hypothetical protein
VINDPVNAKDPLGLEYDPVDCWSISFLKPTVFYVCESSNFVFPGRKDLRDGGDTRGGGGAAADPKTRLTTQLIAALLTLGPGCTAFFGGADTLKQRAKEIPGNITIVEVGGAGYDDPIPGAPDWTFRKFVESVNNPSAVAMTVKFTNTSPQDHNSIILTEKFYNPGPSELLLFGNGDLAQFQRNTLVHEFMHILNNMGDADLANQWKLDEKGYNGRTPSDAIAEFLADDCSSQRKKK